MKATERSWHFILREWETTDGVKQEEAWSDSCLKCQLNNHEGEWEFISGGNPDKDRWWEEERGCHMVLFPPHYFHGILSGDELQRSASGLISAGGYCYLYDILRSVWLFVLYVTRTLWGLWWWFQYISQWENKIDWNFIDEFWLSASQRWKVFHILSDWQFRHSFIALAV